CHIHGIAMSYVYWICATHGYFYQLITAGGVADEVAIRTEAAALWQHFHQIDPARDAAAARVGGSMLTTFDSPDFGISMYLTGLGWQRSDAIAKALPSALYTGARTLTTFFTLQGYRLGQLNPPIETIARATCDLHQIQFDEAANVKRSSRDAMDVYSFEVS